MSWLSNLIKPRKNNLVQMLVEQAELDVKGLEALQAFIRTGDDASAGAVRTIEKEADEVRRILIDDLNRTFATPMDREDIFALSRAIDDILDYAYSTVDEMQVLHVSTNSYMQRMVSLLLDAAGEVHLAMQRFKDHPGVATDHAERAKALENQVESVYREALAALFEGPAEAQHIVEMLKLREIYRHLSNAADRLDEAANIISDVVVKMA